MRMLPRQQAPRSRPTTEPGTGPENVAPALSVLEIDGTDLHVEDEPEKGPLRRCIVTREQGARAALIRFVVSPDGVIVPDLAARLPGRGIWLSARADVIHGARTRQAFSRAARARVIVPDDLALQVSTGLLNRIADLIGFARRAGQAVAGYQKAHEWLVAGKTALIIQAGDGSAEERARFIGGRTLVPVITALPAARLGAIFGRDEAVHVAIAHGKLAESLKNEAARLAGVLGDAPRTGAAAERNDMAMDRAAPADAAKLRVARDGDAADT